VTSRYVKARQRFAIVVVEQDGAVHYLEHEPSGETVVYASRLKAEHDAEFWREGLGDEVQSVSVVVWPGKE
jgi:hypothetical protein